VSKAPGRPHDGERHHALMSFMSADCVFEGSAGAEIFGTRYVGREAVRAGFAEVWEIFPDAHWGDAPHFVHWDRGVSECTFTGTRADGTCAEVHGCDPSGRLPACFARFQPPLMSNVGRQGNIMTVKRMDNVGIVVEDIDAAIEFFAELGLELEGRAPIEGDGADGVTGLRDMRVEIAMMRTPDGHSRLEISRFLAPPVVADHRGAPVNALGYLRVMFTVENIDDTLARLVKRGAELVGEVVQYEDAYRLCYIRGPEGILIGLAQELGQQTSR
jgi:catechol 2,3-dioxygenase-like lactoylglutathione lyase family enzyme